METIEQGLQRFRKVVEEEWGRTRSEGEAVAPVTRMSSVEIACRHFAMPHHERPTLPAGEILRIAAEVTGLPMQDMTDADGNTVPMWWPVRGEVGWLPYKERPGMWEGIEWKWNVLGIRWAQKGGKRGSAIRSKTTAA